MHKGLRSCDRSTKANPLRVVQSLALSLLSLSVAVSLVHAAGPSATPEPQSNSHGSLPAAVPMSLRRVNAPYFSGEIRYPEMAVFWFGKVTPSENHADVRVGYNDEELAISVSVYDRLLWYDTSPDASSLTDWDALTILLNLDGNVGEAPGATAYRFVSQLNWWEDRGPFQAVHQGDGAGWVPASLEYAAGTAWRGDAPNNSNDDRGWVAHLRVPFASLGLSGDPPVGTKWGLGITLHDRDTASGPPLPIKIWPETLEPNRPVSWGQLSFGIPAYEPPTTAPTGTVTIRHKLQGAVVPDAAVGGHTVCGDGLDFWTEWGDANYAGRADFNIQNQSDVADWPCFSRYYVTFPLDLIPKGKAVLSGKLTLHQFGGSNPEAAKPSLIQVLTVEDEWSETTLTWNNAPLAAENLSSAWVDVMTEPIVWPGVPWTWDVSLALARAYQNGTPLRLALYSADSDYHSGKYFVSSDTGDWNEAGRPTLEVVWGEPPITPTFADVPFDHPYYEDIEALYRAGYTAGCNTSPLMFCPDKTMNRAESAVFVERGIHGIDGLPPQPTYQTFADLPLDSWAAKWAEALWQDHYTAGCGTDPLIYCPWQGHTRAEGCVFYLHMLNGPDYTPPQPAQQTFADVPLEAWYAKWVQAGYDAGLLEPCQMAPELLYCPNDPLTRAVAAHMMVQAKGLKRMP